MAKDGWKLSETTWPREMLKGLLTSPSPLLNSLMKKRSMRPMITRSLVTQQELRIKPLTKSISMNVSEVLIPMRPIIKKDIMKRAEKGSKTIE